MALLSIVTPCLNQLGELRRLASCLQAQNLPSLEWIVVDGGSTDGTVDWLATCSMPWLSWESAPDDGQAHAINKGMKRARGDVLGWINCDDRYSEGALAWVEQVFALHPEVTFLYGDAMAVNRRGRAYGVRAHVRECRLADLLELGDPIVQPAAFWRRSLWEDVGELDPSFQYALDYEYWMRVAAHGPLTFVPVCLAVEALHGDAKTSKGGLERIEEIERAARLHGASGMPRGFAAEAAAVEILRGWRGKRRSFRGAIESVVALDPPLARFLAHLAAEAVPSPELRSRLRLVANRWRARHRQPRWPVAVPPASALLPLPPASHWLTRPVELRQHEPRPLRVATRQLAGSGGAGLPSIALGVPSFNQGRFLGATLSSVLDQRYPSLTIAVQDAGSTDETSEILHRYQHHMDIRQEPDEGQADAINRALGRVDGEVMCWLNADDLLLPDALHHVGSFFRDHPEIDVVYGWRKVIDEQGREIGHWVLPASAHKYLAWADYIPQETLFWRRRAWDATGGFISTSHAFALDWEFLLRLRHVGARFACIPAFLGAFRIHPASKTSSQLQGQGTREMEALRARAGGGRPADRALRSFYVRARVRRALFDVTRGRW